VPWPIDHARGGKSDEASPKNGWPYASMEEDVRVAPMEDWGFGARWRYGTVQCIGLGALIGGFEAVSLAAASLLSLSFMDALVLGAIDVGAMALLGGIAGAVVGLPIQALHREPTRVSTTLARHIAAGATLLVGYYLWHRAYALAGEGAPPASWLALSAMPLGFTGVAYFNARFWLRKVELDKPAPVGWLPISVGVAAILAVGAAASWPLRDPGGSQALEGDPNLVLITVDGLRRDDVGLHGGRETPVIDALGARGTVFNDAIGPTPGTRAANATVLVGLHPLRLRVLRDTDPLSRGYGSLFEALADEGWATAAFVSSSAVESGSGLDQGFRSFDDNFAPGPSGMGALVLCRDVLAVGRMLGMPAPWRSAPATAEQAVAWLERHGELPFGVWIHLADPHRASTPQEGVDAVDAAVGSILDALSQAGVAGRTTVIVAGTHGDLRGAHGGEGNRTLFDEVLRVPLIVAPPSPPKVSKVEAQVRLMDVANTAVVMMGLDPLPNSEGIGLQDYASGQRTQTIWSPLVGQDLDGTWLVGMRNNGIKVVRSELGNERMYNLSDDPTESTDIAASQANALNTARQLIAAEQVALDKLLR
jgi:hypothetical protein